MTNRHLTPSGKAGMDESSPLASSPLSRRAVLQLAGGAASLAAIPSGDALSADAVGTEALPVGSIRLIVNGESKELELDTRQSLLDVLRETLDLPGTKKGCNQGACGACTILVDGRRIVSCLTLASMYDGADIQTIEGLEKNGELHPLQQAFVAHEGLQCGFCTPGQIMSGIGCIAEGHAGSPEEIQFWMSGNICRCGAYPGIVEAVADAARRT
ncbi:xanthine dehydrogenase YagT iron-sulfur-binding subunit [Mesorhizobium albiziae]|uniref:Xanthine dehydrogenase YagT iron-sulfur-binding subunit n=2 Tax=Neomesorhizobium albiziae TaxID=335020 RepID=A0A1I3XWA5_9HYPH|nr:aldehyde dehydrogenase [Mesorhizobium albiziae]SFK23825.1 xanthine dehydrogenase YagT iron-sulfur-binding subunit [Mesorhizobium albiziae]